MKTIIRLIIVMIIFAGVLWLGGSSWGDFKRSVDMKDPNEVYEPLVDKIDENMNIPDMNDPNDVISDPGKPDLNIGDGTDLTEDNGIGVIDYGSEDDSIVSTTETVAQSDDTTDDEITKTTIEDNTTNENNSSEENTTTQDEIKKQDIPKNKFSLRTIISIGDKSIDVTRTSTINLLGWLAINYDTGISISFKHEKLDTTEEITTQVANNTTETTTSNNTTDNANINTLYDNKLLKSQDELDTLIATINTVDELPDYDDYDRTKFEKPVKSYKLNGHSYKRNDYAWKTSDYFEGETFTYMCPYTGTVIRDIDDEKEDYDFGNLDYDHIVPLRSAYLRGARDWTDEEKNAFAYDQWVGVDVLNSANRSKSDKGPAEYLPEINIEDYCYSWLLICSKYNLVMTKEELQICKDNIEIALENGDEIEHLGGFYDENKQ